MLRQTPTEKTLQTDKVQCSSSTYRSGSCCFKDPSIVNSAPWLRIGFGGPKRGMISQVNGCNVKMPRTEIEGKMTLTRDEWLIVDLEYVASIH